MTSFTVSWAGTPPSSANADNVIRAIQAAANAWASRIQGLGSIEIGVEIDPPDGNTIATGGTGFTQPNGLYVANTVSEIRTGIDPNGAAPDINVAVSAAYIDQLFYDATSTQPVPANAVDAVSVFTHEIGHGLGILSLAPSAYTNAVTTLNGRTVFTGTNAQIAGNGPVPVLSGSAHVDLPDLMNATASNGRREAISDIDLGILQDLGLPIGTNRADSVALDRTNDTFRGFGGSDTIYGNGGDDLIYGGSGLADPDDAGDRLYGGTGNDQIFGNGGNDVIRGNAGQDGLHGGTGDDLIYGGDGEGDPLDAADVLFGDEGSDTIFGNGGDDIIFGGRSFSDPADGSDVIRGGAGNDQIYGNGGDDVLFGNEGDDTLYGGAGNDVLEGGSGADRYVFAEGTGTDLIRGFNQAEGDRIDLQGQTYTLVIPADGVAQLNLSGGGSVVLADIVAGAVNAGYFA